ncbi:SRPBCC domain-containing protein [Leekyejoonella antrihumi]
MSFEAPIETVWSGLIDPVVQARWLGTAVESDIRPGGRLVGRRPR